MIHTFVNPKQASVLLDLPADYVGKDIEIIAFQINPSKKEIVSSSDSPDTLNKEEARSFWATTQIDLSAFTFNREEANER